MLTTKSTLAFLLIITFCKISAQPNKKHDLLFTNLAKRWDEAIPLGNGMLGALVWQKNSQLRFSLDRADLWDMRPMKGLHRKEFSYQWVMNQVRNKDYEKVQEYFDGPYEQEPAPSKLPGGAIMFNSQNWGAVQSVHLIVNNAVCEVKWTNGTVLKTFVHATKPVGVFRFENVGEDFEPNLEAPAYQGVTTSAGGSVNGDDLSRLGYKQGTVTKKGNSITYIQQCWGGFSYQINVRWTKNKDHSVDGVWSISSHGLDNKKKPTAAENNALTSTANYTASLSAHLQWWARFWAQSAIQVPDSLIEKQWYLEQYKFGSVARQGAPPISLQGVWTADNGRLPPWKGDFHHDLNTQLSYWPCYSGNHLEEGLNYFEHLETNKRNYRRYTKQYFGVDGLAVPGVTTLDGTEMGGWIQYSLSPTVSAWLAQHYYLQWRYSMDHSFLQAKAYPWLKETAAFLENITIIDEQGHRKLQYSSSPEINDNALTAWFDQNTNYDLALMKFVFAAASELAGELKLEKERLHWQQIAPQFSGFSVASNNALRFAPSMDYNQSHRHFSNAMAIHPLGLIKWEDGDTAQAIIKATIHTMDSIGPDYWCGYSYSWMANMKARAKDGEGAAKSLDIFAKAFCSVNSFHLNGDQTKSGYSKFTYRPFTLEGNFAFAAGLQEMLLQSYAGFIEIMPAVPNAWQNVSFNKLRAEGAFLISAVKENGELKQIRIEAEKGGQTKLKMPLAKWKIQSSDGIEVTESSSGFVTLNARKGGNISFSANK